MLPFVLSAGRPLSVLCLGAHSDDIEIGAGGALLTWLAAGVKLEVTWCVLSAVGPRENEARQAADAFLIGAASQHVEIADFRDGYFPHEGARLKAWFDALGKRAKPDLIFAHRRADAHQDHRLVNELTWNTFRNHVILEYEIPKWDGDLGQPDTYVALSNAIMDKKCALLMHHFGTQRSKDWFDAETFRGLARLRGMECRAPERLAEAFHGRKCLIEIR